MSNRQDWRRGEVVTERETAILIRLADGMRPSEIAAELFLSVHTIKSHTMALYGKLGAKTAAHAVAIAYHRGILVPSRMDAAA